MFLVGLTGGIASGKSTVSSIIRELGVDVIDSDLIARQVVQKNSKAWKQIRDNFGNEILLANGEIDRKALADIVFADQTKRRLLNSITHPQIYKQIFKQCFCLLLLGVHFAVIDLPLLFESGYMTKFLYRIIVVKCSLEQQIDRLMARNQLSREESLLRIRAQMSLDLKCSLAHYVIDNSNDINETRMQVQSIVYQLKSSNHYWYFRILLIFSILIIFLIIVLIINKIISFLGFYTIF